LLSYIGKYRYLVTYQANLNQIVTCDTNKAHMKNIECIIYQNQASTST